MIYYIFLFFFAVFTTFPLHLYSQDGNEPGVESLDQNSFEEEEADRLFKKMINGVGPFLMDIPAEEAEKLRLKIKSSEWEKVIRSLTQEEKRKVEQSISDYFQLYEAICVLEKWEKDKKNYNLSEIQKLKLPANADSYLIFYEFFSKIDIQNQNKLLASIVIPRLSDNDFRGERFTEDCILAILKNLPGTSSFSPKKDIVFFQARLAYFFEYLVHHSNVLLSLSDIELKKIESSLVDLENAAKMDLGLELYIRYIMSKKDSFEAETAYFKKILEKNIEDYNNDRIRGYGQDAIVYDYLLHHPDQRRKYMDMINDGYIVESSAGLLMLTWRLSY